MPGGKDALRRAGAVFMSRRQVKLIVEALRFAYGMEEADHSCLPARTDEEMVRVARDAKRLANGLAEGSWE